MGLVAFTQRQVQGKGREWVMFSEKRMIWFLWPGWSWRYLRKCSNWTLFGGQQGIIASRCYDIHSGSTKQVNLIYEQQSNLTLFVLWGARLPTWPGSGDPTPQPHLPPPSAPPALLPILLPSTHVAHLQQLVDVAHTTPPPSHSAATTLCPQVMQSHHHIEHALVV